MINNKTKQLKIQIFNKINKYQKVLKSFKDKNKIKIHKMSKQVIYKKKKKLQMILKTNKIKYIKK